MVDIRNICMMKERKRFYVEEIKIRLEVEFSEVALYMKYLIIVMEVQVL